MCWMNECRLWFIRPGEPLCACPVEPWWLQALCKTNAAFSFWPPPPHRGWALRSWKELDSRKTTAGICCGCSTVLRAMTQKRVEWGTCRAMRKWGESEIKKRSGSISVSYWKAVKVLADWANVHCVSIIDSGNFSGTWMDMRTRCNLSSLNRM